jgi:lycopene cyclase domain-containing protein
MYLYLTLLLFSVAIPFALSFDKKLRFYKMWNSVLPSILIIGVIFIAGDIVITKAGMWGFNPAYHSRIVIMGLPLEEWLFFIFIPYASIFLHFVIVCYFPRLFPGNLFVRIVSVSLIVFLLLVIAFNYSKTYTLISCIMLIITLALALLNKSQVLNKYFVSFLVIFIPFFIVNALMSGTLIPDEIVWYNNAAILGIRLFTIPVEDIGYAFCLILLNLLLINRFQNLIERRNHLKQV